MDQIPNYPNYQITRSGNVWSNRNQMFLKPSIGGRGYYQVNISCGTEKRKTVCIHKLMAITYLNHVSCGHFLVVDHFDCNKLNNDILNLRIVTQKENCKRGIKNYSHYSGVFLYKNTKRWMAINLTSNRRECLGFFENEIDANNAIRNKNL